MAFIECVGGKAELLPIQTMKDCTFRVTLGQTYYSSGYKQLITIWFNGEQVYSAVHVAADDYNKTLYTKTEGQYVTDGAYKFIITSNNFYESGGRGYVRTLTATLNGYSLLYVTVKTIDGPAYDSGTITIQ